MHFKKCVKTFVSVAYLVGIAGKTVDQNDNPNQQGFGTG